MSKTTKWLIFGAVGIVVGVMAVAITVFVWFMYFWERPVDRSLPVYTSDQTDSTHPG